MKQSVMYLGHWWKYDIMPNGEMMFYDQNECAIGIFSTPEMFFGYLIEHSSEYLDDNYRWKF